MTITALPTPPSRGDDPTTFATRADALLGALPTFVTENNAQAAVVNAAAATASSAAVTASAAATTAAGAANFKGAWSSLSGALSIPASVSHAGQIWVLVSNLANVATATPGVSAAWVQTYPPKRIAIFDAQTILKKSDTMGELVSNIVVALPIAATYAVGAAASFVAGLGTSANQVANSTDGGRTWTARTLSTTGIWRVVSDDTNYAALLQGGTTLMRSSDGGATWTSQALGDTWGANLAALAAGGGGKMMAPLAAGTFTFSTNSGANWSSGQTMPATFAAAWVCGGLFVGRPASGSTYHTSASGNTGSWTSRSLPGATDTVVQDFDGSLLAYLAGSPSEPVYRTADGISWTSIGAQLWRVGSSVRTINGVNINGAADGIAIATRHGGPWVPRSANFSVTTARNTAKSGAVHLFVESGNAHLIDPTAGDAALALWE